MPHYTRSNLKTGKGLKAGAPSIPQETDVLIVGAGMSGLYVAWRLLALENPPRVCMLEMIDRTGGRLDSDVVHFPHHEDVKEEEGGMRFTFDGMDDLMTLFVELGLEDQIVPFPMNSGGNNRLYFRGRSFTNQEARDGNYRIWSELYRLDQSEQGLDPSGMINTVFNRLLAANPQLPLPPDGSRPPAFWQGLRLDCSWQGIALKDWTLWGLLDAMGYSNECITMLYRVLGFNGTFLSQMSAGEAFQLLADFPADPKFRTLADGFSCLPNALVDRIGMGHIFLGTAVDRIAADEGGYTASYTRDEKQGRIRAKKVLLAMPRLALEKLYVGSDLLNTMPRQAAEAFWDNLQTTTDQSLLKINLYYDKAWWGNDLSGRPDVSFGPNFSDLPLGSVYPFYAIDPALSAAAQYHEWLVAHDRTPSEIGAQNLARINSDKYKRPAALTIYCDYLNINFWRGLQESGAMFDSDMQRKASSSMPQTIYPASTLVVAAATSLFRKLFNTHHVPKPVLTSARIWSGSTRFDAAPAQQVGFGVHQWGLHADDRAVMKALVEPLPNLYTCGEAFSDFQGWVEGALRSADLVLGQGFGLPSISEQFRQGHKGALAKEKLKLHYDKKMTKQIRNYLDPSFKPEALGKPLDMTRAAPKSHAQFGVALTYLHQFDPLQPEP